MLRILNTCGGASPQLQSGLFRAPVQPTAARTGPQYTGSSSPHRCNELCQPANHRAGSPAVAANTSLSAQMKGERLMIVPGTADGFRATISALRSLDGSKGVSFHTFSLPEDRCVRLIKNLSSSKPSVSLPRESCSSALGAAIRTF